MSMSLDHEATAKHPWPEVEAIQRDRLNSQEKSSSSSTAHSNSGSHGGNPVTKTKSLKKKGGLFSKFRKSTNDVSVLLGVVGSLK